MTRPDRYWLRGLILTLGLYVLASLTIAEPFGDLLPAGSLVRAIASLQIVTGVWLIIFGFSEVLRYARERDWRNRRRHGRH